MIRITATVSAVVLAVVVSGSHADISMIQKQTTVTSKNGKVSDTKTDTSTYWIASDKLRMDGKKESVLLRLDKNVIEMINNEKNSYEEVPLSILTGSSDKSADQNPAAAIMGNFIKMEITVEPTTETKKFGNWNCTKYNETIKIMGTTTEAELWATEDVKVSPEIFKKFSSSMFLRNASMKDMATKLIKEYEKIKGFVVFSKSTSKVSGKDIVTTSEIMDAKEGAPPANMYDVPAKFKQKKWQ
jgi:hypothetical protein